METVGRTSAPPSCSAWKAGATRRGLAATRGTFVCFLDSDDLLHEDFHVFTNAKTNEVNVIYRRKDGKFGLVEPRHAADAHGERPPVRARDLDGGGAGAHLGAVLAAVVPRRLAVFGVAAVGELDVLIGDKNADLRAKP